jgi:CBS domain-containing protein
MVGFLKRSRGLFLNNHINPLVPIGEAVRGTVHAIPENEPVYTAFKLCLSGQRNTPVTDKSGNEFRGIVSSRTLLDFLGAGNLYQEYVTEKGLKVPVKRLMRTGVECLERGSTIQRALDLFKESEQEVLPLKARGGLDGLVSEADIVSLITGPTGVSVREVMTRKPAVARVDHPVCDVASMLVRGGYKRLPVVREIFLSGIVTPLDIISYLNRYKKLSALKRDRSEIERVMNKTVVTVSPEADVYQAIKTMMERKLSMLPVVEDLQVLGVLSQKDILEAM